MDVVIARSMHDQQIALQSARERDRRALFPFLRMIFRQTTVSLLVDRVVVMKVGHGRYRESGRINVRIAKHRIECRRAAAAPTPDSDTRRIDERPLRDSTSCGSLIA